MNNLNSGIISLGCSKNQVDSEMILGYLTKKGIGINNKIEECDIVIVNTCGFISDAKEESISNILDVLKYKKEGKCKLVIVSGCLAKRYKNEIEKEFPEVDLVISLDDYDKIDEYISKLIDINQEERLKLEYTNRVISTPFPIAYIKIADGCDNCCSYCSIPIIRGNFRSRNIEDILEEAEGLVKKGIREIVLISQDTSRYGLDIYGKYSLAELMNKISKIEGLKWIRMLYLYPTEINDELISIVKNNDKIAPYFDIPIQHLNDRILKLMNRKSSKKDIFEIIDKIRRKIPGAIIRTTVIVGFPTETEEEFNELLEGINSIKFDRLGAFTYSKEEDTASYNMKGQISSKIKKDRLDILMKQQQKISLGNNKKRIGKEYEVIVENISYDEKYFVCRSKYEAPDVDGRILVKINNNIIVGEFYNIKITEATEYDLYAEIV